MPLSTDDIKTDEPKLFLFVGPGDAGKSYAASSFGYASETFGGKDKRPAYVIECDGRVHALRSRPVVYDFFTNHDSSWRPGEGGAIAIINRLEELREKCVSTRSAPFHTLIAPDSFTAFCAFCISDCMEDKTSGGRKIGGLKLPTIEDYGYESEAVRQLMWEHLTDIKKYCNVIVTAHEVEKYKKVKTAPGAPSESILDGFKILARDKISAGIPVKFDEIYHFLAKEKVSSTKSIRRSVVFQDELARTSFSKLTTTEAHDISGQEFYKWWLEKIK